MTAFHVGTHIFCFVILFRVCLVDSILRRGLSVCLPPPLTSFPIQVSKIPYHSPAPRPASDLLILFEYVVVSELLQTLGGWETPFLAASFQFAVSGWMPAFHNSSRTRQTVKKAGVRRSREFHNFKARSRKGNNPGVPSRRGEGAGEKKKE